MDQIKIGGFIAEERKGRDTPRRFFPKNLE